MQDRRMLEVVPLCPTPLPPPHPQVAAVEGVEAFEGAPIYRHSSEVERGTQILAIFQGEGGTLM